MGEMVPPPVVHFHRSVIPTPEGSEKEGNSIIPLPANSGTSGNDGPVPTPEGKSLLKMLDVNVVSIVVGALAFIVAIAVVDFIKAFCRGVLDSCNCEGKGECRGCRTRYNSAYRKAWVAVVVGLTSAFMCILIYMWYKAHHSSK